MSDSKDSKDLKDKETTKTTGKEINWQRYYNSAVNIFNLYISKPISKPKEKTWIDVLHADRDLPVGKAMEEPTKENSDKKKKSDDRAELCIGVCVRVLNSHLGVDRLYCDEYISDLQDSLPLAPGGPNGQDSLPLAPGGPNGICPPAGGLVFN
jgi:hypothetical protein